METIKRLSYGVGIFGVLAGMLIAQKYKVPPTAALAAGTVALGAVNAAVRKWRGGQITVGDVGTTVGPGAAITAVYGVLG